MAKQSLNIGTTANDNTGDTLRSGGDKINDNFNEIYTALGNNTALSISLTNPSTGQVLKYNGSSFVPGNFNALTSACNTASRYAHCRSLSFTTFCTISRAFGEGSEGLKGSPEGA